MDLVVQTLQESETLPFAVSGCTDTFVPAAELALFFIECRFIGSSRVRNIVRDLIEPVFMAVDNDIEVIGAAYNINAITLFYD